MTAKFEDVYGRLITEDWMEWERESWTSECDKTRSPQATAPRKDADSIKLAYLLLVHEQPYQIRRLVDILDEPGYNFIIHVDGKESSQSTYDESAVSSLSSRSGFSGRHSPTSASSKRIWVSRQRGSASGVRSACFSHTTSI